LDLFFNSDARATWDPNFHSSTVLKLEAKQRVVLVQEKYAPACQKTEQYELHLKRIAFKVNRPEEALFVYESSVPDTTIDENQTQETNEYQRTHALPCSMWKFHDRGPTILITRLFQHQMPTAMMTASFN
jgi:hypothetical protein